MKKFLLITAPIFVILTGISVWAWLCFGLSIFLTLSITFGTTAYHFVMRLIVGFAFNIFMGNKADLSKKWYHGYEFEKKLYDFLKIRKLKKNVPTFDRSLFDPRSHTWQEIAEAMCQAELVHETIAVLSFLPIIAGVWFGEFPVFIITSVLAALFDLYLATVQRYNRPRIIKHISESKKGSELHSVL